MWLIVALLGSVVLAVVGIMDKFILTKSVAKPVVYAFYSTVFVLPIFLLLFFGVKFPSSVFDWVMVVASGFFFALGLWAIYKGVEESEVSHVGPLIGAATAFFVFILSRSFLKEILPPWGLAALVLLIFGSLIISFEKSRRHNGWHGGMLWGVLGGVLMAASHVTAKYAYTAYGFYSGFVWTRGMIGVFGLLLLLSPLVRRSVFGSRPKEAVAHKKNPFMLITMDKFLGIIGMVLIQYAVSLGSVTLVNAMAGVQYAILIILVAFLSKFFPKLFREQYAKGEAVQEILAVIIIAGGFALMCMG